MATATYTTSYSSELTFSSHPSGTLSGPSTTIPDNAVISYIKFSVYCGVTTYNYNADCNMTLTDSSGKSVTISSTFYTGESNRVWAEFGGKPSVTLDWNSLETIELSGTNKLVTRPSYTATLTIEYMTYSRCGAPEELTLSTETAAPGASVTLEWKGATAGENNDIAGYQIGRATSADGSYDYYKAVSSTATSGQTTVTAPTTNGAAYYYKVLTVGTVDGYNSPMSVEYATLTCAYGAITAPTTVKLSATNAAPNAGVTLEWSGATVGTNNAIVGYEVYRAESEAGEYTLLTTVETSEPSGSTTVNAPAEDGKSYYYKVLAKGELEGYDSSVSSAFATLTCTYSMPSAPSTVTVDDTREAYALPGTTVRLTWSGATDGVHNDIVGYDIYRDGVLFVEGVAASASDYPIESHGTAGQSYEFTVVTKGEYSDSAPSLACTLRSYSDPVAPEVLIVDDMYPPAGGRVQLSWSGAQAGGYNEIKEYRVYRSTTEDGAYTQTTTSESQSCYVSAPSTVGSSYYFRVETVGAYSTSGLSEMCVSITAREAAEGEEDGFEVIVTPKPPRKKRGFIFGEYDTAAHGWTLTGWSFPEPEPQTSYVEVPGRMAGPLDLSAYLTGGDPRYGSRELTVTLEHSDGTRLERNEIIDEMVNYLHGNRDDIVFPDDEHRYAVGRFTVEKEYSDPAHAAVTVTATCEPWRYSKTEVRLSLMAITDACRVMLYNDGRRVLIPEIKVSGYGASVKLTCNGSTWTLTPGTYRLPELRLPHGNTILTYQGVGTVDITYREAVL